MLVAVTRSRSVSPAPPARKLSSDMHLTGACNWILMGIMAISCLSNVGN